MDWACFAAFVSARSSREQRDYGRLHIWQPLLRRASARRARTYASSWPKLAWRRQGQRRSTTRRDLLRWWSKCGLRPPQLRTSEAGWSKSRRSTPECARRTGRKYCCNLLCLESETLESGASFKMRRRQVPPLPGRRVAPAERQRPAAEPAAPAAPQAPGLSSDTILTALSVHGS